MTPHRIAGALAWGCLFVLLCAPPARADDGYRAVRPSAPPATGYLERLFSHGLLSAGPEGLPSTVVAAFERMRPEPPARRLPAEFEQQRALLLGCRELPWNMPDVYAEIVHQTGGKLSIVSLVGDREDFQHARQVLLDRGVKAEHVRYAEVSHDTMWSRDYGPMIVQVPGGSPQIIDAEYDEFRAEDDRVPRVLAELFKLPRVGVNLQIEGGNLLTNGQGLFAATFEILDGNYGRLDDESTLAEILHHCYGARETVLLEPLSGESTGHVDMFATFVSADTVVVGSYDPKYDPINAELLDANAAHLAAVRTPTGPLRVVRIPMPPHDDGIWRTYTNVIYANGVLLVPVYPKVDRKGRRRALETYARLLPGWKIVEIDAEAVCELGGALHCVSMNLGPLGPLPEFPEPSRPRQFDDYAPDDLFSDADGALIEEVPSAELLLIDESGTSTRRWPSPDRVRTNAAGFFSGEGRSYFSGRSSSYSAGGGGSYFPGARRSRVPRSP